MFFTNALEQVVHAIHPGNRPSGGTTFPRDLPVGIARRGNNESAQAWLKRCVNDVTYSGDLTRATVEENLALFLVVRWNDRTVTYANLQALWVEAPLARFMSGTGTENHRYLRLDYDPSALGPLLKEPHPHVHIEADGEPRFPIPVAVGDDVVGWFLDFVYRNFFYEDWIVWAEVCWEEWCSQRSRANQWPRLVQAFNQSALGIIEADQILQQDLRDLKRCLLAQRRRFFPLATSGLRSAFLSHEI